MVFDTWPLERRLMKVHLIACTGLAPLQPPFLKLLLQDVFLAFMAILQPICQRLPICSHVTKSDVHLPGTAFPLQRISVFCSFLFQFLGVFFWKKSNKPLNFQNSHILQKINLFSNLYLKCYHLLS